MDLRLLGRVIWRYRVLIAIGWVLATMAAFLSVVRVSSDGLSYRQSEFYSAEQDLYFTERGFNEGRTRLGDAELAAAEAGVPSDPGRIIDLTTVYVELIDSDPVRELVQRDGPVEGTVFVQQFTVNQGRTGLPAVRLTTTATDPATAVELARRQTAAFREFLVTEQDAAGIAPRDRVVVEVLRAARGAELVEGRSMTSAAVIFVAIMAVFIAAALILNNLRRGGTGGGAVESPIGIDYLDPRSGPTGGRVDDPERRVTIRQGHSDD